MVLRVDVSRNGDQAVLVAIENLLQQQAYLKSLGRAPHGRQQVAFSPAANRLPNERLELLSRDACRQRRAQVYVDYGEQTSAGQFDIGQQNRAIELDRLDVGGRRDGRSQTILWRRH